MAVLFPAPDSGQVDLLIIAGEHSGDQHMAQLLKPLKEAQPHLNIYALGGAALEGAGAKILWDMNAFSVVGFVEVLKNYTFLKALFNATYQWIDQYRPKAICFVDYPGFNLRLAKRLFKSKLAAKAGGPIKLFYYVGPQIWAWKASRRFAMAEHLDSLGVIFPFEVDCYHDTALTVDFVGHPFLAKGYPSRIHYNEQAPILLLPGSRRAAVARIFPIMLDAFEVLLKTRPNEQALILYQSNAIQSLLLHLLAKRPDIQARCTLRSNEDEVAGKALLASSGTMSLSCALAGIPGAILYRAHPITYCVGKMVAKVPYLGMANILLNQSVYPEYLQHKATPKSLAEELEDCLVSPKRSALMQRHKVALGKLLRGDGQERASHWLENCMQI